MLFPSTQAGLPSSFVGLQAVQISVKPSLQQLSCAAYARSSSGSAV